MYRVLLKARMKTMFKYKRGIHSSNSVGAPLTTFPEEFDLTFSHLTGLWPLSNDHSSLYILTTQDENNGNLPTKENKRDLFFRRAKQRMGTKETKIYHFRRVTLKSNTGRIIQKSSLTIFSVSNLLFLLITIINFISLRDKYFC